MPKIDMESERERLDRCTGLAKEHDNHHYYKVFADYVRKHLEKL